jgi:hypothetical protein
MYHLISRCTSPVPTSFVSDGVSVNFWICDTADKNVSNACISYSNWTQCSEYTSVDHIGQMPSHFFVLTLAINSIDSFLSRLLIYKRYHIKISVEQYLFLLKIVLLIFCYCCAIYKYKIFSNSNSFFF